MPMMFRELDGTTREWMARRFAVEESDGRMRYRSRKLSDLGLLKWPSLMLEAITDPTGSEMSLEEAISRSELWHQMEMFTRNGVSRPRHVNIAQTANSLARSEFNTWYVAGLAHKLLDEGETQCVVYRADEPKWAQAGCTRHEGAVVPLAAIVDGHRRGYWPPPGVPDTFAIPAGPGCHHSIARVDRAPSTSSDQ